MKRIKVVAALIETNDKVLIAQRLKGHLAGKWEFPGGKVEEGELEEKAIVREIYEEFNISVKCDYFVCNNVVVDNEKEIDLRLYHCTYLSGEVVLQDHSSYVFVDKKLLLSYDLAEADIELAKYVVNN
ncbi:MAG: (deoxy)nucleoside triphosphate pyrophosphohydrolase [Bacilli bacterium]|nr:(deoxy)nucleoside triphosphate pyrophosphohydrolase [Bacilli bacterium]